MDDPGTGQTARELLQSEEKCPSECSIIKTGGRSSFAIPPAPASPEKIRNPWIAALCSACCVGLGQFYNGRTWEGISFWIFFLILFTLGIIFTGLDEFLIFVAIGGWLYGIYDAFTIAGAINKGQIGFRGISEMFFFPVLIAISLGCSLAVYWVISAFT
jgi:TM2 domain-containing membrane protein YozV